MRFLFLSISVMVLLTPLTVNAQGLPANPWAAKQEVIGNTVLHVSRDDINPPVADNNMNIQEESINFDTQELKDTALRIKEKLQQNSNQIDNNASNNEEVSAVEAFNAFNTLSKYVGQNNQSDNSKVQNNTSSSFDEIKRKMQEMMKKSSSNSNSYSSATSQSSELTRELNKAKNKYHHYKSQVTSNYNNLKGKAQPMIDSVKKSINEAEKATGMKF